MIRKELDASEDIGKFAVAGRKAEDKMAFYLKRYFENNSDIYVLNNIRLEFNGDAAQMDHLVIHTFGISIIESKSVHGKVQIKDDGQWVRWYGNQSKGMASPITQAKLQATFLKNFLNRSATPKDFFNSVPMQVMIAISDDGHILWPKGGKLNEVWKADQISDQILLTLEQASLNKNKELLNKSHIEKICSFLCQSHKPVIRKVLGNEVNVLIESDEVYQSVAKPDDVIADVKVDESDHKCPNCKSAKLEIRFGHTYYFHCLECEKNVPIKTACPICKDVCKLRKKKSEFFSECIACKTSNLFYINP